MMERYFRRVQTTEMRFSQVAKEALKESACSVDPLVRFGTVHHLESKSGALIQDFLGAEALVLVVTVGSHACSEVTEGSWAFFLQNVLTGGAFVLSCEAANK